MSLIYSVTLDVRDISAFNQDQQRATQVTLKFDTSDSNAMVNAYIHFNTHFEQS